MLRHISRKFIAGLLAILPLALTIAVIAWMVEFTQRFLGRESAFGKMLQSVGLKFATSEVAAYLIGLLHDIGRFVMFEHAAPELLEVDESNWETPEELIEAEVEVYKFTHSELGYRAAVHWQLPKSIREAIRLHHTPIDGDIVAGSSNAQQFCLQVADHVSLALLQRDDFEEMPPDVREQRIVDTCLTTDEARNLLPPAALATHLDRLYADGHLLLDGLGFN